MTNVVIVFEYGLPTVAYSNQKNINIEIIDLDRANIDPDNHEEELKRYEQVSESKKYYRQLL